MHREQSNSKRIAKNTIFLYIRMLFNLLVSLYTSRVVLSMLGEIDFGIYGVVAGFVTMFAFLNTSMTNAIQRFFNFEWGKNGEKAVLKVYSHALVIQVLLALLLVLCLETFGVWYINNVMVIPKERLMTANWVFQFSVLSLFLVVLNVPYSAAIMAYERMDFYAIIGVLDVCIKLLLAIVLQYTSLDKLFFWALLTPITSLISFLAYFIYCKSKLIYVRFKRCFDRLMLIDMVSFAGWNLFGSASGVMKEQGINLVLNYFFGPVVNAARSIASQVSGAVMGFVGNLSIAVRPQLTKSYAEGDEEKAIRYMYTISKINYLSFLLFVLPLTLELTIVLDTWLVAYPDHTKSFIKYVFLTCAVNLLNAPLSMVVHASGKMRNYQIIGSCINMIGVPLAFVGHYYGNFAPEFSLLAIFLSTLAGQIASLFILRNIVRCFSINSYIKEVLFPIVIVTVLASIVPGIIHVFLEYGGFRFFGVLISSTLSISLLSYIYALNTYEKNMVKMIFTRITQR